MINWYVFLEHVATRRLIEASAALDPPSRALLNVWLHRGLTDEAIADMAGLDREVIATRKLDIVERLSGELGLPTDQVLAALGEIARAPQEPVTAGELEHNGGVPVGLAVDERPREVRAGELRTPARRAGGRRTVLAVCAALAALVVVLVLVLVLTGASARHAPYRAVAAPKADRPTARSTAPSTAAVGSEQALKPLSLTAPHAAGHVTVSRSGAVKTLNLTVSGLPPVTGDHYEVWLYNSIIDARPLGRIDSGVSHLSLKLPAGAGAYREIDISLQPPGAHYDSGESVLRAKNPIG